MTVKQLREYIRNEVQRVLTEEDNQQQPPSDKKLPSTVQAPLNDLGDQKSNFKGITTADGVAQLFDGIINQINASQGGKFIGSIPLKQGIKKIYDTYK